MSCSTHVSGPDLERMVGERGFEPPTPWSRKRDSGVVLNVFNLIRWCFDHLSPAQLRHSGVNVSPRMAVPDQGFIGSSSVIAVKERRIHNFKGLTRAGRPPSRWKSPGAANFVWPSRGFFVRSGSRILRGAWVCFGWGMRGKALRVVRVLWSKVQAKQSRR